MVANATVNLPTCRHLHELKLLQTILDTQSIICFVIDNNLLQKYPTVLQPKVPAFGNLKKSVGLKSFCCGQQKYDYKRLNHGKESLQKKRNKLFTNYHP